MSATEPAASAYDARRMDDPALEQLRERWGAGWRIWRGRRALDPEDVRTGAWVASRIIDVAGIVPTAIADTADQLDRELMHQSVLAHAVRQLVGVLQQRNMLASPVSPKVVQVVHPITARRETVLLSESEQFNRLSWYWFRDCATELIGVADNLDTVANQIVDTLSRPAPAASGSGAWQRQP